MSVHDSEGHTKGVQCQSEVEQDGRGSSPNQHQARDDGHHSLYGGEEVGSHPQVGGAPSSQPPTHSPTLRAVAFSLPSGVLLT